MAACMSQHFVSRLLQVIEQPFSVLSHLHLHLLQHRLKLHTCTPSRTQQQVQSLSQIASHRLCRSVHSAESSQQQRMRKPPTNFSNENSQAAASCISNFASKFVFAFAEVFFITLQAINRAPTNEEFRSTGVESEPPIPLICVGRRQQPTVAILRALPKMPHECYKKPSRNRLCRIIRERFETADPLGRSEIRSGWMTDGCFFVTCLFAVRPNELTALSSAPPFRFRPRVAADWRGLFLCAQPIWDWPSRDSACQTCRCATWISIPIRVTVHGLAHSATRR